jgi:hypothetical protein
MLGTEPFIWQALHDFETETAAYRLYTAVLSELDKQVNEAAQNPRSSWRPLCWEQEQTK